MHFTVDQTGVLFGSPGVNGNDFQAYSYILKATSCAFNLTVLMKEWENNGYWNVLVKT